MINRMTTGILNYETLKLDFHGNMKLISDNLTQKLELFNVKLRSNLLNTSKY